MFCDSFRRFFGKPHVWYNTSLSALFFFCVFFSGCNQNSDANLPVCTLDEPLECSAIVLVDGEGLGYGTVYSVWDYNFEGRGSLLEVNSSVENDHTVWTLELKMSDERMLELTFSVPPSHQFHVDQGQEIQYQVRVSIWNGHQSKSITLKDLDGSPLFTRSQHGVFHPEIRDCKPFEQSCGLVSSPQLKLADGQIISVGDTVQTEKDGVLYDYSLCRSYYLEPNWSCNDVLEEDMVAISTIHP